MASVKTVTVSSPDALRHEMLSYASRGYSTFKDEGTRVTLSRQKRFNWLLMIILLFIPIVGWIALGMMLVAHRRGHEIVEIRLRSSTIPEVLS